MKAPNALLCHVLTIGVLCSAPAAAQPTDGVDPAQTATATALLEDLGAEIRTQGGWSEYAELFNSMADGLWADSGWHSETDLFAKELAHEVTRIPPWQFNDRIQKMTDMLADRYKLSSTQKVQLQSRLMRESFGFMIQNAEVLVKQGREFISTRAQGNPFTLQQIARWSEGSDPLLADTQRRIDRIMNSTKRDMSEQQRKIIDRDYAGFSRRTQDFNKKRAAWARGEWKPGDWGLQDDPIQSGRRNLSRRAAGRAKMPATIGPTPRLPARLPGRIKPADESTWDRYVREFIETHHLDAGQRATIRSILAELQSRTRQYRQRHLQEPVPAASATTSDDFAPIQIMFQELEMRSNALLTERQRAAAKNRLSGR
ncbi:MAG: hypothetical protein V3W34_06780 [Phycisphaerae bacterium]